MVSKVDPAELETTQDLLDDFAASQGLTPEKVYKDSWSRYQILQQTKIRSVFDDETLKKWKRRDVYAILPRFIHKFIYQELFTFAGNYRQKTDPGNGIVRFGPQHGHKYTQKFSGDPPDLIVEGVYEAVGHLIWNAEDLLLQAIRFYQKFVNVHPFYDANGRIARMIANIYLANHELVLSWKDFDGKGKFIKKLNYCHKNPTDESFQYLVNHIRPFMYTLNEEDA
ncbi:MAG: Fic family protein [Balneolaceae bacterium]|nr:Fic family protein [Balneolaceae bacterium]